MPPAGGTSREHPKKVVSPKHYTHYCAGIYDFVPDSRPVESCKEENEKAYDKGMMTKTQYDTVREHLGTTLATKYRTCRQAFRMYDEDCTGDISRREVRKLFEYHGYTTTSADRFFNHMDNDRSGAIEYKNFTDTFAPYIQPTEDQQGGYKGIFSTTQLYHNTVVLQENRDEEGFG